MRVVDYILTLLGWAHGARDGTHLQLLVFFRGDHLDPTRPSAGGRVARAAAARGRAREHRASLLRNARGENARPARAISSFGKRCARDRGDVGRPNRFSKERSSHRSFQLRSTCRFQLRFAFFSHRGRFAKSPQNPVDRARTVDFPRSPRQRVSSHSHPLALHRRSRARARVALRLRRIGPSRDGQGAEEDAG